MIRRWTALFLLLALVSLPLGAGATRTPLPFVVDDGCAHIAPQPGDNTAILREGMEQATQSAGHCLRLGAGIYLVSVVDQALVTLAAPGLDIGGVSSQSTIIQYADDLTIGAAQYYTIGPLITGNDIRVHDLAVHNGARMHNPPGHEGIWIGIEINGGLRDTVERVDVSGAWGPLGTAGGVAIGTYQPGDTYDGHTDARILNNTIHDNPSALGLGLASGGNLVQGNRIWNTGENAHQHDIYDQGGANQIVNNMLGPSPHAGYNYHGHHSILCIDGGESIIEGNTFRDPGFGNVVVDAIQLQPGDCPNLPAGTWNAPDVLISGNTFTDDNGAIGIFAYESVHAVITNNVFRGAAVAVTSREANVIQGNQILQLVDPGRPSTMGIYNVGAGAIIQGNQISLPIGAQQTGIRSEADNARIVGNTVVISNGVGIFVGGTDPLVQGNSVTGTHGASALELHTTNGQIRDNTLSADWVVAITQGTVGADVTGNVWHGLWRVDGAWPALRFAGNSGTLSYYGYQALPLTADSGRLVALPHVPNSPVSRGDLLAWQAGGLIRAPAGSPTFAGVNLSDGGDTLPALYVVTQPGAVVRGICSQGTPVLGNVGVISLTQAGCVSDTGLTEPPPHGSWVRFLGNNEMEIHP